MATKSMAYDHPAYTVPVTQTFACAAGANAVSVNKFVAYTNMIVKSATTTIVTAGTSAGAGNAIIVKAVTAQGVTTSALGTFTLGTGTSGVSANLTLANTALAQGEYLTFTNGTDATGVNLVAIEAVVTPGSTVTS